MHKTDVDHDAELREHLKKLLASGESHATNKAALDDFPVKLRDKRVAGFDHSAWQLLEHMRLAQADILRFCIDPQYSAPVWPDDYWPSEEPASGAWDQSRKAFFADLEKLQNLVADPKQDLLARILWGSGQTLLREAMLVADHNSYHLGQIFLLRKALGA